ncbi:uncharacterized protein E0L32_007399 [Thyridium curvatum]|uniref:Small nuclear ribonucleoprotein Prp3 C-terminal domain-containing protein n=1 Tax=Thyridium curvatum TaxID=1093900 RepID=A0A507B4A7_9PEZI|nr:uncharacterized protein E0L32_007399 [Thyridium curvatum]TPX11901.1 hypothetical protein E0L32_007399 [Thyridium curvatum]
MSDDSTGRHVLPKDLMEMQLGQIDLLMAMYAPDDAISIRDDSMSRVEELRSWCESDDTVPPPAVNPPSVNLRLTLTLSDCDGDESKAPLPLQLDISVPIVLPAGEDSSTNSLTEPPKVKIRAVQPEWMSRADVARLNDEIPDEDLLTAIEHVKEAALAQLEQSQAEQSTSDVAAGTAPEPLVRVWFYFPSISTRAKRDDLIDNAPRYGLTGFLLAGKPGVMCLEGGARAIDDYMRFIKTESWGDIPPQHKKVSERYREAGAGAGGISRAFADMREITDVLGERRGERANRNDMKALEAWLNQHGVGGAFSKILI